MPASDPIGVGSPDHVWPAECAPLPRTATRRASSNAVASLAPPRDALLADAHSRELALAVRDGMKKLDEALAEVKAARDGPRKG